MEEDEEAHIADMEPDPKREVCERLHKSVDVCRKCGILVDNIHFTSQHKGADGKGAKAKELGLT